jgi:large subunit ribosomal protein L29
MPLQSEEIRDLTDADIRSRIAELEEERFRLRFRAATEPLDDPLRLRSIRKDIARLKTILRQRTLEATASADAR